MINYFYDCYCILNKVYSEKTYVKQAISSTFIEEKNRPLTVKTVYGVLDKDIELSYYIKQLAPQTPKLAIRTILKISMYALKYLEKKEYAVVKNAVELVKKLGKGGASGFVNAFLHKFINSKIPLPSEIDEKLSILYSFPLFAIKELINVYGEARTECIIKAQNAKTTLAFYDYDGEKYLTDKGVKFVKTPFKNVFTCDNFVRNEDFDKGIYTFQALGSVAICDVVTPSDSLLDCCAAPGGKSIRLSYKFRHVTSCDIHQHRVELIKSYYTRMRRDNVTAFEMDSKAYNPDFDSKFDAVLCDAPCSGLGVVNDNPDIKLNRSIEDLVSLNNEQISILNNVCKYVKIGGYLYYSTCSILESENINIIKEFLDANDNFAIEDIDSNLPCEKILGTVQFLPDVSGGLGFYVAKLKRVK
ncbi:MAG: methyltransferase domain-containing protein [Clostridia bacterium]|nr:methyltransferase domain-containing protein [Clostridia bacterium]